MMGFLKRRNKAHGAQFLFHFEIQELSNIPQSSGYCYVKWQLKNGTGNSGRQRREEEHKGEGVVGSNQSRGMTEKVAVKNRRARWDYKLDPPAVVKLLVDRQQVLGSKKLKLEIYFEFLNNEETEGCVRFIGNKVVSPVGTNAGVKQTREKHLLGTIVVDLVDYVNVEKEVRTQLLLLQNSKINSILKMKILMQLMSGKVQDFKLRRLTNGSRTGLNDIFEESSSEAGSLGILSSHSFFQGDRVCKNGSSGMTEHGSPLRHDASGVLATTFRNSVIEKLYQKTFIVPWDLRPGEFSPKDCVEDIIKNGNGWAKDGVGHDLVERDKDYDFL